RRCMPHHPTDPLSAQDIDVDVDSSPIDERGEGRDAALGSEPARGEGRAPARERFAGSGLPTSTRSASWLVLALLIAAAAGAAVWSSKRSSRLMLPGVVPHGEVVPGQTPGKPTP
ncbi:MAG TPA: hypothetical protein VEQ58_20800, partial [Polyangiaceae bacterium]|nr:hypothetical protein [Polyangiaceae bacterium]